MTAKQLLEKLELTTHPIAVWAGIPPQNFRRYFRRALGFQDTIITNFWKTKLLPVFLKTILKTNKRRHTDETVWLETVANEPELFGDKYTRREWTGATSSQRRAATRLLRNEKAVERVAHILKLIDRRAFPVERAEELVVDNDEGYMSKIIFEDLQSVMGTPAGVDLVSNIVKESMQNPSPEAAREINEPDDRPDRINSINQFTVNISKDERWKRDREEFIRIPIIGDRIEVWWQHEKQYFAGVVKSRNLHKGTHDIIYDDGPDIWTTNLKNFEWRWVE